MLKVSEMFFDLITEEEILTIENSEGLNHPIKYILSDENDRSDSNNYFRLTQSKTKKAVCSIAKNNRKFLDKNKQRLISSDISTSAAILGEIRCYGILLDTFGNSKVMCINEKKEEKTPDFKVSCNNSEIFIEVKTIQIDEKEKNDLSAFQQLGSNKHDKNKICIREHYTRPYGTKKSSGITPSVIYKLCSIKQQAEQLPDDKPSIIWVDVQDEYMNAISDRLIVSGPVFSGKGNGGCVNGIRSNEIWYSLYAPKDTIIFDGETLNQEEGIEKQLAKMKIDGRFVDNSSNKVSALIFNGPNALTIFENPNSTNPLPCDFIAKITSCLSFKIESSRINFLNNNLEKNIKEDMDIVNNLSKMKYYSW